MFIIHLKTAFRQLARNSFFSGLNILGLSLGMALALLIAVFIKNELSYDRWIADSDRIYRVYRIGHRSPTVWTPPQLAQKLMTDYPEVATASGYAARGEQLLTYAGEDHYVDETAAADSTFFDLLSLPLLHGDPRTALDEPNSMVISDDLARRIFGASNPVGETVTYEGNEAYVITGVIDGRRKKSHISFDVLTRFTQYGDFWRGNNRGTYVKLKPGADHARLAEKIEQDVNQLIRQEYLANHYEPNAEDFFHWKLQPLREVYLQSEGWTTIGDRLGSLRNLYIFGLIAFLVLAVAVINYVNMTTAKASQRSKEVGVKKVIGARRSSLTTQFLTESVVQSLLAGVAALLLAEILLPFFNGITDRELALMTSELGWILPATIGLALLTGIVAGSYPAFILSGFQPVSALKSGFLNMGETGTLRKVLVTGQFAVSITLFIVMAFVYRQVHFMLKKDLGFQPDQVLVIPMNQSQSHYRVEQLKDRFRQIPGVQEVTTASSFPGQDLPDWKMQIEGRPGAVAPWFIYADADFAEALDLEVVAGRFLDEDIAADSINNFVVNEEFVNRYGIEHPIGQKLKWAEDEAYGQIVGVIKDFHYRGLAAQIDPLVMNATHWRNHAGIKLSVSDLPETIAGIEEIWRSVEPAYPMRYSFLDDDFATQYVEQQRFGETVSYATLLTVFVALLGLFGLTTFTVERRTKEIGIRKVLGASVGNIIQLLTQDFVRLLGVAFLIAVPVGYYLSHSWLTEFAYRTNLAWWVFLGAGLAILLFGFLMVGLQSMKAALTNPVISLRDE